MSQNEAPLIDAELAARIVERALRPGGDFAEGFCEERAGLGLAVDESRVERVQRGAERGAGVRVVRGEATYFAHVDGLGAGDLERAADAVAAAAGGRGTSRAPPTPARRGPAPSARSRRRSSRYRPPTRRRSRRRPARFRRS